MRIIENPNPLPTTEHVCEKCQCKFEHTVTEAPRPQQPENIRTLAGNIIKFNFRFLKDFDQSEWD